MPSDLLAVSSLPRLALFPWGDLIEDFLETINTSLAAFCREMSGGWLFGYVDALKQVGVDTVIFCFSDRIDQTTRYHHLPTGATVCVLPAPERYRWLRRSLINPYAWTLEDAFGPTAPWQRPYRACLKDLASYLAHPIALLAQELRRERCHAILCQEYEYARFDLCVLLGKRLGLPVFATFQGGNFQLSRIERWLRPHTLRACAGLIVPSQAEIQRLQTRYRLPAAKIHPIFNPLDLSLWQGESGPEREAQRRQTRQQLGLPAAAQVVVYHGRMELYRKGIDVLLDAWIHLRTQAPDRPWWLLLIGTGSDAPQIHARIDNLPQANICWLDQYLLDRAQLCRYLNAADLYVLPSRHEGFPVAPLEAMACGLPVIATEVPGIADILVDHEASGGIRIPSEQPQQLAAAIVRVLNDEGLRQQLGQRARQRVESHFSLAGVGAQLRAMMFPTPTFSKLRASVL